MNRKQIAAVAVIVLLTTVTGAVFTATMPVWLPTLFLLPASVRNQMMETFQARMAREMTKFLFSTRRMGKQLA